MAQSVVGSDLGCPNGRLLCDIRFLEVTSPSTFDANLLFLCVFHVSQNAYLKAA